MKKTLLSLFALAAVSAATAQTDVAHNDTITFGTEAVTLEANSEVTYTSGDFSVVINTGAKGVTIDTNNAKFGEGADSTKFVTRWKAGGKTGSDGGQGYVVKCPAAGTLKIAVRSASSSAADRNIVITKAGEELVNKIVQDADAVEKMYPYVVCQVTEACDLAVSFPTGALNTYAFIFIHDEGGSAETPETPEIPETPETPDTPVVPDDSPISDIQTEASVVAVEYYTLTGSKVDAPVKGLNIVKTFYSDNTTFIRTIVK